MSNDGYVAPVNHGVLSATGNVITGTAGGALKTGLTTAAIWIGAMTLGGVAIAAAFTTGGAGIPILSSLGAFLTNPLTIGGAIGATLGLVSSWLPGGIGAIFGGFTGGAKASDRVQNERTAAAQVQMQIEAMRAQSMGRVAGYQTMAANDNKYNLPEQGSSINPAMAKIDGSTINRNGTIDSQRQLQQG